MLKSSIRNSPRLLVRKTKRFLFFRQRSITLSHEGYRIVAPSKHTIKSISKIEPFRNQFLRTTAKHFIASERNHVIDVGANIGDTALTILAGSLVEPKFTLVEPSNFFLKYLRLNVCYINQWEIVEKVVSPNYPITDLNSEMHYWGGTAQILSSETSLISQSQMISLHSLVTTRTGLIKLDCDGLDTQIFQTFLQNSNYLPVVFLENTITDRKSYVDSINVTTKALEVGYRFAAIARSDGLLIWGGEIGLDNLQDIFRMQLNFRHMNQEHLLYHTDLLLVPRALEIEFQTFLFDLRKQQDSLF